MPRRPTRTAPTLILHGLGGPGPEHWYSWLTGELRAGGRDVRLPELPGTQEPVLRQWLDVLRAELSGLPEVGFDLLCHSAGSLLWLHHCASRPADLPRPARVALIGVPDADHIDPPTFRHVPLDPDAVRTAAEGTVLVGSDDDPACPAGAGAVYGGALKMATTVVPEGGHFDPASGYGPWPALLGWCGRDNLAFY